MLIWMWDTGTLLMHLLNYTEGTHILKNSQRVTTYNYIRQSGRRILSDGIVNLLVAGHETTPSILKFSIHKLMQYPGIVGHLRQEIQYMLSHLSEPFMIRHNRILLSQSVSSSPSFHTPSLSSQIV